MTRCRSQALLGQNALHSVSKKMTVPSMVTKPKPLPFARLSTSKSSLSVSVGGARSSTTSPSSPLNPSNSVVTMTPRPSSSSSGYTPLICEICKKEYANNSTLRRHGKIHAYANASSAARKICKPRPSSTPISPSAGPIGIADNSAMSSLVHGDNGSLAAGLNSGGVSTISSTLAAVNTHLLSSFWPYRDSPAPALPNNLMTAASSSVSGSMTGNATTSGQLLQGAAAAAEMMIMPGYNPGYDPTIKKPECIGCNKPFARRDTVILHIKNQKRKWDLLCAMLPTLAASASSTSSISHTHGSGSSVDGGDASDGDADDGDNDDAASSNSRYRRTSSGSKGGKLASTAAHRRSVRQKKAHPFRVAEKLWQSTLQKKKIQFGAYKKTPPTVTSTTTVTAMSMTTVKRASATESAGHGRKSLSSSSFGYGGDDDDEFDDNMHVDEHRRHLHQNHSEEDMEIMNAYMEADDDDEKDDGDEDEDGWPSEEALEEMDNATKIRWMMRMAVVPPCWSERKVRIFGVQGEVEEAVLQDG
ncbi:hypothetical protein BGZ47_001704 [Haplosporangium gracile]|nr:hypothetical protein BGZ47_001704 [Haplosporangium gracile]